MMNTYELENIKYIVDSFMLSIESAQLGESQIHVISGPNGSGKTTLLDILSFVTKPSSGDVLFQGRNVSYNNPNALLHSRRTVSYLMQNPYLFNMNVFENIAYRLKIMSSPADFIKARVENIMQQLSLSNLSERNAHRLSKGETQRVAIARTLAVKSAIYILDEPMTNVDRNSVPVIRDMILHLNRKENATVIIAAHSAGLEEIADNIISMDSGKITDITQRR